MFMRPKQPILKPQDLVVALKIAANQERQFTFNQLAIELNMSSSEIHAAFLRAEKSRLVSRLNGKMGSIDSSLREFVQHGVKYAFPPVVGATVRGMPTGVNAAPLNQYFANSNEAPLVWPTTDGSARGQSLLPLHPSVTEAVKLDYGLYELLALIDAIRCGAAREREMAISEIGKRL
jgi:hypothetical protein